MYVLRRIKNGNIVSCKKIISHVHSFLDPSLDYMPSLSLNFFKIIFANNYNKSRPDPGGN
jgi:hypothetical protein